MPEILIIADDLSGATDCGMTLASAGVDTVLLLDSRGPLSDADALVLDLDTRRLPAEPAAALNVDAARRLHAPGTALFMMAGAGAGPHWAAEIAAVHIALTGDGQEPRLAVVVPPVAVADAQTQLSDAGLQTERAAPGLFGRGDATVRAALRDWLENGVEAVVCEATSPDDLASLARVTGEQRERMFWVGPADLVRHLPGALGVERRAPAEPALPTPLDPVLVVVGSGCETAHAQAAVLADSGGVRVLSVEPHVLRVGPGTAEWGHAERDLREALGNGGDVLLRLPDGPPPPAEQRHALAVALGRLVHEQGPRIGGLVLSGGETVRAVLAALGIGAVRMLDALEPGVPVGVTEGPRPIPLILKTGSSGEPETLVRARQRLRMTALPPVPDAGRGGA